MIYVDMYALNVALKQCRTPDETAHIKRLQAVYMCGYAIGGQRVAEAHLIAAQIDERAA